MVLLLRSMVLLIALYSRLWISSPQREIRLYSYFQLQFPWLVHDLGNEINLLSLYQYQSFQNDFWFLTIIGQYGILFDDLSDTVPTDCTIQMVFRRFKILGLIYFLQLLNWNWFSSTSTTNTFRLHTQPPLVCVTVAIFLVFYLPQLLIVDMGIRSPLQLMVSGQIELSV